MATNQLTNDQMARMASGSPSPSTVPTGAPQTSGLLTPTQMAAMAAHSNPSNPDGAVGTSWDAFDKATGGVTNPNYKPTTTAQTANQPSPLDYIKQYAQAVGKDYQSAIPDFLNAAGSSKSSNPIVATAEGALRSTESGINTVFAPITQGIKTLSNAISNSPDVQKFTQNPVVGKVLDFFNGANGQLDTWAKAHPEAAKDLSSALTIGLTLLGSKTEPVVNEGLANTGRAAIETAGDVASSIGDASKGALDATKNTALTIKNKIAPTPTIDSIIGQVAQGSKSDVPSFARGISNIDTSNIKTYADLNSSASSKISTLAKAQDANLALDSAPRKVQQLAINVGGKEAAHNYVIDAINQLKDYYVKTNDIANLNKIKSYEAALDPVNGKGLTLNQINDIARIHGSDLNAYNSNGELASGLTKQAAENTRVGIKNTIEQSIQDPNIKTQFRNIDKQISDTYTVRDLSQNMADKVNTLSQRLQKVNILQKVGGTIGKFARVTGVGDLASKLLGIEKVPGSATLNAVELESKLSKNLAKINAALGKNDSGFTKDIVQMINESAGAKSK